MQLNIVIKPKDKDGFAIKNARPEEVKRRKEQGFHVANY